MSEKPPPIKELKKATAISVSVTTYCPHCKSGYVRSNMNPTDLTVPDQDAVIQCISCEKWYAMLDDDYLIKEWYEDNDL